MRTNHMRRRLTGALSVSSDLHLQDMQRRSKVRLEQRQQGEIIRRDNNECRVWKVGDYSLVDWWVSYLEEVVHYLAPVRLLVVDQQARRRLKKPNRQRVFITLWQKEDCVSCLSWFGPVAISLETRKWSLAADSPLRRSVLRLRRTLGRVRPSRWGRRAARQQAENTERPGGEPATIGSSSLHRQRLQWESVTWQHRLAASALLPLLLPLPLLGLLLLLLWSCCFVTVDS